MQDRLVFLIGAPRSGTTLLARMLSAHSQIHGRAEPHLITPIAHLGYFGKVQKAPYDQNNVEQAIREIVAELPRHEAGYLDALRAYTDSIYAQLMELAPAGKRLFLDKTPAYALVLPFLTKLYPQAKYVVLTRHPLAVRTCPHWRHHQRRLRPRCHLNRFVRRSHRFGRQRLQIHRLR